MTVTCPDKKESNNESTATLNEADAIEVQSEQLYKQEEETTSSKNAFHNSRSPSVLTLAAKEELNEDKKVVDEESCRNPDSSSSRSKDVEKNESGEESSQQGPTHGRLLPLPKFLIVYACLALAVLLTSLDQTVVSCILPSISSKFGSNNAPRVGIAFLLTQTTCSPLYGRMSDVFGRKVLFLIAHVIFLMGTVICAAAPSMLVLILGRAIAGCGGAGLFSMVHICVSDIVTLRKRGTYHGILSAINGTGAALGPLIGGLFASKGPEGWRLAFYFQVPIIVVAAIATCIFLPSIGHSDVRLLKTKVKTIDYLGSVLFAGGTTVFLLALLFIKPPSVPFESASVLSCFFVGLAVLVAFFIWEGKGASHPIVPLSIFRNISVDLIFFLNFTFGYIFYSVLYYVPQFFQVVSKQDAIQSSITLLPVVVSSIVFSWATGLCTSVFGSYKLTLVVAFIMIHIGSVLLWVFYKPGISQGLAAGILLILGIGFGCQLQNTLVACQSATRQRQVAMATAVRNFFRNIGGVVGIAISGMIIHLDLPRNVDANLGQQLSDDILDSIEDDPLNIYHLSSEANQFIPILVDTYAGTLRWVFMIFVPLSALSVLVVLFLPEYSLDRSHDGEPIKRDVTSCHPRSLISAGRQMCGLKPRNVSSS